MLGVENRTDLRRASLISEIYSETAGPTGGNVESAKIRGESEPAGTAAKAPGKETSKLAQAGITNLKGHPAFRPKRVTKSGLAKLSKIK